MKISERRVKTIHKPVLAKEILERLSLKPGMRILDATVGAGGHARLILEQVKGKAKLIGLDQDQEILKHAAKNLKTFSKQVKLIHSNFRNMEQILKKERFLPVHVVLFDLGVSSLQLDTASRGFSFQEEGPLDMRMDTKNPLQALALVNTWSEEELARCFYEYGEERKSRHVARAIVEAREKAPLRTTRDLAQLALRVLYRQHGRRHHPATQIFQALRIAVNDELGALSEGLTRAAGVLSSGGRLAAISFHSLEDRLVKQFIKKARFSDAKTKNFGDQDQLVLNALTKKPITPSLEEIAENPRARSAKLRVAEKV